MYLCIYIYIYIYIYVCACACVCMHTYIYVCACMYTVLQVINDVEIFHFVKKKSWNFTKFS